ncbi:hypothetical protein B834_389 [Enterococcus mundtii 1A]|nr:hypothetical protein AK89_08375 [Enterococcus mundtii CRL35]MDA9427930.1 hypothetical protein [Enterococcus mundtii 1A]
MLDKQKKLEFEKRVTMLALLLTLETKDKEFVQIADYK